MLTLIRRAVNSKVGVFVTLGVLALIALMFGMGDITGAGGSAALAGTSVAKVGKSTISERDLQDRVRNQLDAARQQQPTLDVVQFVNEGGMDSTLNRTIDLLAFAEFARREGMVASKRLVDGQIASMPATHGLDGRFSQAAYQQMLGRNRITDQQLRDDIENSALAQFVVIPLGQSYVPAKFATPYASLLLEKRDGAVGFIPTPAMGKGAPPTDAELAAFYKRNSARYTIPERRVIRFATVTFDSVKATAVPTDAEIAKGYALQKAKFQATEKRDLVQVVIADQAAANALVAKAKGGAPIEEAARAAGLEPNALKGIEKPAYTTANSPEIANAAFSAAKGAVLGPFRTALGYTVVRVDNIENIAAKSLEQAKPELVEQLGAEKTAVAMQARRDAVDDAIGKGATFDEIVADQKLTATDSAPLTSAGINPEDAASKADPAFAQAVTAAFAAEQGDDPQLVPIGTDGSFSLVSLSRVIPASPRALAQIRDKVASDFVIDRAQRLARQAAVEITARVNKGMPLAQSMAATKLAIPGPTPLPAIARGQIENAGQQVPAPVTLMFSMAEKTARMIEAPQKAGWYVVYLNHIERGNATGQKPVIDAARAQLSQSQGREYVQQLTEAVRRSVGVKRNDKAIGQVRAGLVGQGGSN